MRTENIFPRIIEYLFSWLALVIPHLSSLEAKDKGMRKSLFGVILLGVAIVVIAALFYASDRRQIGPMIDYMNIKGEKITAQQLQGKLHIVNFWATSCSTCVAEMPDMVATYQKFHQRGLEFVAVAMSYDPPNYVLNFTETRQLPFHVALDVDGKIARAFGDVKLTPTSFLIDKHGKILKRYVGQPSFAELNQLIEQELNAG
jgi:peroxiredoxin